MNGPGFSADLGFFSASNSNYHLHCHSEYEIFMFIEGDSKYVVEDKNYSLEPHDVIIIRKHEMHRIYHNTNKDYNRLSIMVSPDFFKMNGCKEYERAFLEERFHSGNKISAETVRKSGLYDAFIRLKNYSDNYTKSDAPVVRSTLIEILHLINKISIFENSDETNSTIKKIINYINNHFTNDITLDFLCKHFFISKYYLCRIFKQNTGLTIQAYIRQKRLLMVSELQKEGKNLTEAAILAGFNNYSAYYRAHLKNRA